MTRPPRPRPARSLRRAVSCVLAAELGVLVGFKVALWAESVEAVRRSAAYLGREDPYPLVPPALADALQRADVVALCAYAVALCAALALLPARPNGVISAGQKRVALAAVIVGALAFALAPDSPPLAYAWALLLLCVGLGLPALLAGEAGARGLPALRAAWLLVAGLCPLLGLAMICLPEMEAHDSFAALTWPLAIYVTARFAALAWTRLTADRALDVERVAARRAEAVEW